MKIYGNKPPENQEVNLNVQKVSNVEVRDKVGKVENTREGDKVDISGAAKTVAELMAAIGQLPDIRTDRVNKIKEAIESGNYNIDPAKIAEKMLEEI